MTANLTDGRNQQHIRLTTQETIATCAANLSGFIDRWTDAIPYMNVFEFLRQKIMWNIDTAAVEPSTPVLPADAELYLEQLKKSYLHRAVLGMIEDMMYGGSIQQEHFEDDLMESI
ncbi:Tetratricopeptide-like helical [Penicillium soppii]|jgi:hypothetical protein|uniref:Tetratricopeptide-like helical n=1 Tax=Penicillium soppii TaxID=69789 RepID=UPI00254809A2|nr:Tetratricopeptide-like helical [Penicillium soppii]KAJ5872750.1 Tetratricopeptide-like helical [Penicillium soppii]